MSGVPSFHGPLGSLGQAAEYARQVQTQAANAQQAIQYGLGQATNLGQIAALLGSGRAAVAKPETDIDRRIRIAFERVDELEKVFVRTVTEDDFPKHPREGRTRG